MSDAAVQLVRVFKGKFSVGRDKFRDFKDVEFPLVDGKIRLNEKGSYIQVNGIPVRGFPKRIVKIFIDSASDFQVLGAEANPQLAAQGAATIPDGALNTYTRLPSDGDGTGVRAPTVGAIEVTPEQLNGPDDAKIKDRIKDRFFDLKRLAWAIANQDINALVVSGPPGVGKSTEIIQALEHEQDDADVMAKLFDPSMAQNSNDAPPPIPAKKPNVRYCVIGGKITAAALYEQFYAYADERSVVVLDDVNVWGDETTLDIIKQATSSDKLRRLHWKRSSNSVKQSDVPDSFIFKGGVIFITNKDFENPRSFPSNLQPHIEAIMSRCYYLDMTMHTLREKFLRIEQVCIDEGLVAKIGLDEDQCKEVFEFFKAQIGNFREVSIRTVQKIATMRKLNGGDWQRMASITTMRTQALAQMGWA